MKTTRVPLAILGLLIGTAILAPGNTSLSASFGRSGFLRVEKECSEYKGQPGQFCTITSSNISEITPGSKVVYTQPARAPQRSLARRGSGRRDGFQNGVAAKLGAGLNRHVVFLLPLATLPGPGAAHVRCW